MKKIFSILVIVTVLLCPLSSFSSISNKTSAKSSTLFYVNKNKDVFNLTINFSDTLRDLQKNPSLSKYPKLFTWLYMESLHLGSNNVRFFLNIKDPEKSAINATPEIKNELLVDFLDAKKNVRSYVKKSRNSQSNIASFSYILKDKSKEDLLKRFCRYFSDLEKNYKGFCILTNQDKKHLEPVIFEFIETALSAKG